MFAAFLNFFKTGPDIPVMTDKDQIDRLYKSKRFRMMIGITLCYGCAYTCRLVLGMVKKPLIDGNIFTPVELGLIGSTMFYSYGLGKLFNGFLADHSNMKKFLACGFLFSGIAVLAMGFTKWVALAAALWALNGWFQSLGAPGSVVAMAAWFSNHERGRIYGIWSTAHSLGEGLTFFVVGVAVTAFGWQWGYWGAGITGIICAVLGFWLIEDRPRTMGLPLIADYKNDHGGVKPKEELASVLRQQLAILKIPAIWILGLASALNYVTRYAINSWGVLYLNEIHHYTTKEAGSLLAISTVAGVAGAIAFGFLSDKVFDARRAPCNALFAVFEIVGLLMFFYGPTDWVSLTASMVLFGFGLTGLVTSLGGLFAVDICPKRVTGAAMGVIGIFSYIGAAIQEHVSGWLIQSHMTFVEGVRTYDFQPAIMFWCGACILSAILAATLWGRKISD